jgi:RND family efflux transporter MFP subunit
MDRDNAGTGRESSRASLAAAHAQLAVARSQIESQRSQVLLAEANVQREQAALKISQTALDNTRILAPFSGYISARNLDAGAAVSSQAAGTSSSSVGILVLQDIETVNVQVEVEERHISLVRPGSLARVYVDAYPDKVFEARATRIVHALDPRSRTLGVEMAIVNREHLLKPGMYARVELIIERRPGALLVPGEAVSNEGSTQVVYVVKDGVVRRRQVATGLGEGTLVEVVKGLQADEAVVVEGKELVREGQKVRAESAR